MAEVSQKELARSEECVVKCGKLYRVIKLALLTEIAFSNTEVLSSVK